MDFPRYRGGRAAPFISGIGQVMISMACHGQWLSGLYSAAHEKAQPDIAVADMIDARIPKPALRIRCESWDFTYPFTTTVAYRMPSPETTSTYRPGGKLPIASGVRSSASRTPATHRPSGA